MSKTYEVKVYDVNDVYLTTWTDVVTNISFNNEINSAGGQLSLSLARNAGDYGEGSDVDFNHKVVVYCFDLEQPNGQIVFQGYISAYTPIYKDNKVDITVLSFGAELGDYMIEAGESLDISQTTNNGYDAFGNASTPSETRRQSQTVTAVGSGNWNRIELTLKTRDGYTNVPVYLLCYSGATLGSGTLLATSSIVSVTNTTEQICSFVFEPVIPFTDGQQFNFLISTYSVYNPGSAQYPVTIAYNTAGGYAGGSKASSYNA